MGAFFIWIIELFARAGAQFALTRFFNRPPETSEQKADTDVIAAKHIQDTVSKSGGDAAIGELRDEWTRAD